MDLGLHAGKQRLAILGPRKVQHFPQPKVIYDSKKASRKDLLNTGKGRHLGKCGTSISGSLKMEETSRYDKFLATIPSPC